MTDYANVTCLTDKYGNFIKGKVYLGKVERHLDGSFSDVVINDEEGDSFRVSASKGWLHVHVLENKPVVVLGYQDRNHYKVPIINTTSRSKDWGREFSPFFLGPVKTYDDCVAQNVENAWQYSKVYTEHTDANGNPTEAYFRWRDEGWNKKFADRYPMGKGAKPLYSYWDGQKYGYLEARRHIYAPVYSQAVLKTQAFKELLHMYEAGEPFALLDFDGYDYLSLGRTLVDVMNDPRRKMGHAFVLAMLLESQKLREKYA